MQYSSRPLALLCLLEASELLLAQSYENAITNEHATFQQPSDANRHSRSQDRELDTVIWTFKFMASAFLVVRFCRFWIKDAQVYFPSPTSIVKVLQTEGEKEVSIEISRYFSIMCSEFCVHYRWWGTCTSLPESEVKLRIQLPTSWSNFDLFPLFLLNYCTVLVLFFLLLRLGFSCYLVASKDTPSTNFEAWPYCCQPPKGHESEDRSLSAKQKILKQHYNREISKHAECDVALGHKLYFNLLLGHLRAFSVLLLSDFPQSLAKVLGERFYLLKDLGIVQDPMWAIIGSRKLGP